MKKKDLDDVLDNILDLTRGCSGKDAKKYLDQRGAINNEIRRRYRVSRAYHLAADTEIFPDIQNMVRIFLAWAQRIKR